MVSTPYPDMKLFYKMVENAPNNKLIIRINELHLKKIPKTDYEYKVVTPFFSRITCKCIYVPKKMRQKFWFIEGKTILLEKKTIITRYTEDKRLFLLSPFHIWAVRLYDDPK